MQLSRLGVALLLLLPACPGADEPGAGSTSSEARMEVVPRPGNDDTRLVYEVFATQPGLLTVELLDRVPHAGGPVPTGVPTTAFHGQTGPRYGVAHRGIEVSDEAVVVSVELEQIDGAEVLDELVGPLFGGETAALVRAGVERADERRIARWKVTLEHPTAHLRRTGPVTFLEIGPTGVQKTSAYTTDASPFTIRSGSANLAATWWLGTPPHTTGTSISEGNDPITGDFVIQLVVDDAPVPMEEIPVPVVGLNFRYEAREPATK